VPIELPFVPEPVLTPEEKRALADVMRDPAFWEWFERLPEPEDDTDPRPDADSCIGSP